MAKYTVQRCVQVIFQLLAISLITFLLMHIAPGGPFERTEGRIYDQAMLSRLEETYGLDKPISQQYIRYLIGIFKLDLGPSLAYPDRKVADILAGRLPFTLLLGILALILATFLGAVIGRITAFTRSKAVNVIIGFLLALGISVPPFIMSFLLIVVFSVHFRLFEVVPSLDAYSTQLKPWILPVIALGVPQGFVLARYVRAVVVEEKEKDYVRTARAKGLSDGAVKAHILRNALLPIITASGSLAIRLALGEIVVEQMFVIPGLGTTFISAIGGRDYPIIMAITLFYTVVMATITLVVDLSYSLLDPRVSLTG